MWFAVPANFNSAGALCVRVKALSNDFSTEFEHSKISVINAGLTVYFTTDYYTLFPYLLIFSGENVYTYCFRQRNSMDIIHHTAAYENGTITCRCNLLS